MGGTLRVESRPGEGSLFSFTARFALQKPAEEKPMSAITSAVDAKTLNALRGLRVLIVAQNHTYLRIFTKLFTRWSTATETAEDASAAVNIITQALTEGPPFGIIVADTLMPGIDSISLAQYLRKDLRLAEPIILMLSTLDCRKQATNCQDQNLICLEKPFMPSNLFKVVATALGIVQQVRDPEKADTHKSGVSAPARALRVLLAEDTPANQKLVASILIKRGHTVTVAETGQQALQFIELQDFDVILMDVQMPVLDGFQATTAIRKLINPRKATVPIIALTAHALKEDAERCLAAGMDAYLSKPIDVAELTSLIERLALKDAETGIRDMEQTSI
jgi:CheY-like chemotaxis protein